MKQSQRSREGVDRDQKETGNLEILFNSVWRERDSLKTSGLVSASQRPSARTLGKYRPDPDKG